MTDPVPEFSIIIPARNMERFVTPTLDSVSSQTLTAFEVICIDDGSTDGTRRIFDAYAQKDARFRPVSGPAKGVSAARNLGLEQASGAFVLFLDADDLLHSEALQRFHASLSNSDAVGAVAGVQRINVDGEDLRGADNRALIPEQDQLAALLRKNYVVNGGALALRTQAARQAGGYDTSLKNGEDWEFWSRVALEGRFEVVPGPALLLYRQVATGANFQTRDTGFTQMAPCIEKIAKNPAMQQKFGAQLRRLLRAREIDRYWSNVRNQFQYGRKPVALLEGLRGVIMYPDSLFRPKLIWRFVRSLDRRV
ncbi:glycosyltransferase family 2 protein [Ruegeria lacuscaerulensis]|uniref:glycosyltransferase family 2 protein n=1 Tax=Ruegeria lacuscaerulensis TaxID=55218 RepID=UPI001480B42A|nr:glycosyltransferase family A protein [Ruegeria lacuscaerulensis]